MIFAGINALVPANAISSWPKPIDDMQQILAGGPLPTLRANWGKLNERGKCNDLSIYNPNECPLTGRTVFSPLLLTILF